MVSQRQLRLGFGLKFVAIFLIPSSLALYLLPETLSITFIAPVSSLRLESFRVDRSTKNKTTCQVSQLLQTKCPLQKRNK